MVQWYNNEIDNASHMLHKLNVTRLLIFMQLLSDSFLEFYISYLYFKAMWWPTKPLESVVLIQKVIDQVITSPEYKKQERLD